MISLVIPHYPFDEEINKTLKKCVDSVLGYDELILVVNDKIGFGKAVNQGLRIAKGDFICVMNNDVVMNKGSLKDLADPIRVTSPSVNDVRQPFWGCCFMIPRWVYDKVGGFDEQFEMGYFEDEDYIMKLKEAGIEMSCRANINIVTQGGATMYHLPDRAEIYARNQRKFEEKWGVSRPTQR